jgi:hypothetical protein
MTSAATATMAARLPLELTSGTPGNLVGKGTLGGGTANAGAAVRTVVVSVAIKAFKLTFNLLLLSKQTIAALDV